MVELQATPPGELVSPQLSIIYRPLEQDEARRPHKGRGEVGSRKELTAGAIALPCKNHLAEDVQGFKARSPD